MGVRSLTPALPSEFATLKTLRRMNVAIEGARSLCSYPTHQIYLFTVFKYLLVKAKTGIREISKKLT